MDWLLEDQLITAEMPLIDEVPELMPSTEGTYIKA
jgi:hypothetical protein